MSVLMSATSEVFVQKKNDFLLTYFNIINLVSLRGKCRECVVIFISHVSSNERILYLSTALGIWLIPTNYIMSWWLSPYFLQLSVKACHLWKSKYFNYFIYLKSLWSTYFSVFQMILMCKSRRISFHKFSDFSIA